MVPLSNQNPLSSFSCITIKIGSALLVDAKSGKLRQQWLNSLATDIAALKSRGVDILIVSSGAISLGRSILGLTGQTLSLPRIQAAASAGQVALSEAWRDALAQFNITTGQILLTPNITEERRPYINARNTISTLLGLGAVPVINENDSVATAEIRYGDNDRLSARVASMIGADCLVLFSDVDGLYTAPPGADNGARHLPVVKSITNQIEAMAKGAASHLSRGGMTTKIDAAKIATRSGTSMIIADGTTTNPLAALTKGAKHTIFPAKQNPAAARKRWILGTLDVKGQIHVDRGAANALLGGKSLLPIGVTKISGEFEHGEAISILDPDGVEIARGLAGMNREEANLAKGKKSEIIIGMFGHMNRTELVHADNLVLIATKGISP
ncbi:MAG TPA: glutamate 5-kinase [Devosia sp.]|nr:glutamate 5-kinase [Devosia sp.]